jgi:hypothetical protein
MWRNICLALIVSLLIVGGTFAAEATVNNFNRDNGTLTLVVNGMRQTVNVQAIKFVKSNGTKVDANDIRLDAGTKVGVTLLDGKVIQVTLPDHK